MPETYEERRAAVLAGIDLGTARGLEVGALHSPMVPPDWCEMRYADWTDAETLRKKYAADPVVDTSRILDVDYIWAGQQGLRDIVGERRFDFVTASHVVEHVPDLVTWLSELTSVLAPGGEIRLVVPDKRFTFDWLRNESRSAEVLEAWIEQRRVPAARAALDFLTNFVTVDYKQAWHGERPAPAKPAIETPAHWLQMARECETQVAYHDVHSWVFTPRSFALLLQELVAFDAVQLGCSVFRDTMDESLDFIVGLCPMADKEAAAASWIDMASRAAPAPWDRRADAKRTDELGRLHGELERARADLDVVRASTSWRVTAPLRWLGGLRR